MPDTYTIYQDGKTFANERNEKQANDIFNMLKRTFPQTDVKLVKWRPVQGFILLKQHTPKQYVSGVLHWFNETGNRTTCGISLRNIETADIRTHTTCKKCIESLKRLGYWRR